MRIPLERLQARGVIEFRFPARPKWDSDCHIFVVDHDESFGEPIETDEMRPVWVSLDAIPFEKCWPDDRLWLPRVLKGEFVLYRFWHNAETSEILRHECVK